MNLVDKRYDLNDESNLRRLVIYKKAFHVTSRKKTLFCRC